MVDLEAMREWARKLRSLQYAGVDDEATADYLDAAVAELAERRREPVAQGPSVEERRLYWLGVFAPLAYAKYADVTSHGDVAEMAVAMADAMLAAERAPTYPERKP